MRINLLICKNNSSLTRVRGHTATSRTDWSDCDHLDSTCSYPVPRYVNLNLCPPLSAFSVLVSLLTLGASIDPVISPCCLLGLILTGKLQYCPYFLNFQTDFSRDSVLRKHTNFLRNAGKKCSHGTTMTNQPPPLY